jgi:glycosyltransferase involved in cell wall biosynthesis
MNCYNGEKFLKEAINSVYNQKYQNWEIIFWDNQSTDKSKEIIETLKNDKVKYFYSKEHTNLGKARAEAINKASGDFIAFLDVDDLWDPEKISKQILAFEDQTVGISITNSIYFDDEKSKFYFSSKPNQGKVFNKLLINYYLPLETVMIRSSILKNNNLNFDGQFHHICDFDLFSQVCFYTNLKYIDEPLSKWRIHENNASKKDPYGFIQEKKKLEIKFNEKFRENKKTQFFLKIFRLRIFLSELIYLLIYKDKKKNDAVKFIFENKKLSLFFKIIFSLIVYFPFSKNIIHYFRKKKFLI